MSNIYPKWLPCAQTMGICEACWVVYCFLEVVGVWCWGSLCKPKVFPSLALFTVCVMVGWESPHIKQVTSQDVEFQQSIPLILLDKAGPGNRSLNFLSLSKARWNFPDLVTRTMYLSVHPWVKDTDGDLLMSCVANTNSLLLGSLLLCAQRLCWKLTQNHSTWQHSCTENANSQGPVWIPSALFKATKSPTSLYYEPANNLCLKQAENGFSIWCMG